MGRVRKVWTLIDNYGLFRIGSDGSWLGLTVDGQNLKDATGAGGPIEGATASIKRNNTVNISNSDYSLTLHFEDGQHDAAQEFVDRFNYFANPATPSE